MQDKIALTADEETGLELKREVVAGQVSRLMFMPAAKGLFHKVICQSGGTLNYRNTDPAKVIQGQQAVAAETLKNLKLEGSQIDKLQKVPYLALLAAGNAAVQTLSRQGGQTGMAWNPSPMMST